MIMMVMMMVMMMMIMMVVMMMMLMMMHMLFSSLFVASGRLLLLLLSVQCGRVEHLGLVGVQGRVECEIFIRIDFLANVADGLERGPKKRIQTKTFLVKLNRLSCTVSFTLKEKIIYFN